MPLEREPGKPKPPTPQEQHYLSEVRQKYPEKSVRGLPRALALLVSYGHMHGTTAINALSEHAGEIVRRDNVATPYFQLERQFFAELEKPENQPETPRAKLPDLTPNDLRILNEVLRGRVHVVHPDARAELIHSLGLDEAPHTRPLVDYHADKAHAVEHFRILPVKESYLKSLQAHRLIRIAAIPEEHTTAFKSIPHFPMYSGMVVVASGHRANVEALLNPPRTGIWQRLKNIWFDYFG